jgi:hypothetical protein
MSNLRTPSLPVRLVWTGLVKRICLGLPIHSHHLFPLVQRVKRVPYFAMLPPFATPLLSSLQVHPRALYKEGAAFSSPKALCSMPRTPPVPVGQ